MAPNGSRRSAIEPFMVTVPNTHPTTWDAWIYDVHLYPKNAKSDATKTVTEDLSLALGQDVAWTIRAEVPEGVNPIVGYRIEDTLDARLGYVATGVDIVECPAGVTAPALVAPDDYTVTAPAAGDAGLVSGSFTALGTTTLESARGCLVSVVITTTVEQAGEISNTAEFFPNGGATGTGVTTQPVQTKFGTFNVLKADTSAAATPLAGAVFSVFSSEAEARSGGTPIVIDGVSEFTSGADGTVAIEGLRFSGFKNGVAQAKCLDGVGDPVIPDPAGACGAGQSSNPVYQTYWLVEVKAPSGYELRAEPIAFTVDSATGGVALVVTNVAANAGFTLPLTRGAGATLVTVFGVLLFAGSVVVMVIRSRRVRASG